MASSKAQRISYSWLCQRLEIKSRTALNHRIFVHCLKFYHEYQQMGEEKAENDLENIELCAFFVHLLIF